MTKAQDIRELISEHGASSAERKALERLAEALDETLEADVPFRPEFKAQLRRQLMTEARRTLTPWYRRSAFLYSGAAVAAAAAVLAVGIKFVTGPAAPGRTEPPSSIAQAPTTTNPGTAPVQVARPKLPPFSLPDQPLLPRESGPAPLAGLNLNSVPAYLFSARPDGAQFARIARGLDFAEGQQKTGPQGFWASDGKRKISMTLFDGHVQYEDTAAGNPADPPVVLDDVAVRQAAQSFLVRAALPVPGLEPLVAEESYDAFRHAYTVIYTPSVRDSGLPVINARTVIRMTDRYKVLNLDGFVQFSEESFGSSPVIPPADAIEKARQQGGGTFTQADLVYAMTPAPEAIYLQPVWRVFGTDSVGRRFVRFVPAAVPQ